jgi:hypothetical protein
VKLNKLVFCIREVDLMKLFRVARPILLAAALIAVAFASTCARATTLYGVPVYVASDGDVTIKFQGGAGAGYTNDLYLDSPSNSLGLLFSNHVSNVGDSIDLGSFSAGTELLFRMHSDNSGTIYDYFTGPAGRNPDSFPHNLTDDAPFAPQLYVGFEDQFGGGDVNYGDMDFSLTNAKAAPEPASICLFTLGATALLIARKRQRL